MQNIKYWIVTYGNVCYTPSGLTVQVCPLSGGQGGMVMNDTEAQRCVEELWDEYCRALREDEVRRAEVEECCIAFGKVRMKYGMEVIGEPGPEGYPVYIALHGGGGSPTPDMNDRQWEHMGIYYKDSVKCGIYINPRGVRDTWDTHANPESYPLYDRLIENLIVFCNADPNRIYLLGFSAGGDGVYLVGPRMADRFAALHMSAGHPNKGSMVNLYHTPIQLQVGMDDDAYDRNHETVRYQVYLDALQNKDPDGYIHNVYVHVDKPHNFRDNSQECQEVMIDNRVWLADGTVTRRMVDSNAVHFLEGFTRDPLPKRIIWELKNRYRARMRDVDSFYWLRVPSKIHKGKVIIHLEPESNSIVVERDDTDAQVTVLLRDGMLDLDKPVTVVYPDGRRVSHSVSRSRDIMEETLKERGDRNYIFTACLTLDKA